MSKPTAFNVAEYEVFIDMISDSLYQVSFKIKPISGFFDINFKSYITPTN